MASQQEKFEQAARAAEPAKPARGWRYYVRRIMIDIAIGYALLCLGMYLLQKRLIYPATKEPKLSAKENGFGAAQARDLTTQSSDGVTLRGWHIAGTGGLELEKAPLVELFFGGNAGHRGDRVSVFRRAVSLGAHVVCFDYRGYGDSDGVPEEDGLARDARAAWDFLRAQKVPASSIVIHGESLGGGVAARLASELCEEKTPPAGLVLEATFTRLGDVAGRHYPFLPVSLILTQRFPSVERIPRVTCPLLMFHGKLDEVVPFALGQALFAAAPEKSASGIPKEFVELPLCNHNDVGDRNAAEYRAALKAFYGKLCPSLRDKAPVHPPRERTPPASPVPQAEPGIKAGPEAQSKERPRRPPRRAPDGNRDKTTAVKPDEAPGEKK